MYLVRGYHSVPEVSIIVCPVRVVSTAWLEGRRNIVIGRVNVRFRNDAYDYFKRVLDICSPILGPAYITTSAYRSIRKFLSRLTVKAVSFC